MGVKYVNVNTKSCYQLIKTMTKVEKETRCIGYAFSEDFSLRDCASWEFLTGLSIFLKVSPCCVNVLAEEIIDIIEGYKGQGYGKSTDEELVCRFWFLHNRTSS